MKMPPDKNNLSDWNDEKHASLAVGKVLTILMRSRNFLV